MSRAETIDARPAPQVLSQALCPWLAPAYRQLSEAHAAGRLGHGWILIGPEGIGKINLVLAMAARLLEPQAEAAELPVLGPKAAASAMERFRQPADLHPDLHWLRKPDDKNSILVEQVRDMSAALGLKSFRGGAKVAVIENAELMTTSAANALLKTLEEPTSATYLFLLTRRVGTLPATVRSRCQEIVLVRPGAAETADWLESDSLDTTALQSLQTHSDAAPLAMLEALGTDYLEGFETFSSSLDAVYEGKLDPQTAAEEFARIGQQRALEWLIRRIQLTIRARSLGSGSNCITVSGSSGLHNLWEGLTLETLFRQLDKAQTLQYQAGRGINEELALRALLLGFDTRRA